MTTISKSVSHFGEHKRLHLESSKQNYYIISLRAIIKAIFTSGFLGLFFRDKLIYFRHLHRHLQGTLLTFDIDICRHLNRHLCTPLEATVQSLLYQMSNVKRQSWGQSRSDTLQNTAEHCDTLRHTATHCNTLQHIATHCNTLHYTATHRNTLKHTKTHCNTLQDTATHCDTLQHTATHCNTLQHTAASLIHTDIYTYTYICVCA